MPDRPCVYCGAEVTSPNPEVDYCSGCHYGGIHFNSVFYALIAELPLDAYWTHTGGGCFCLEIPTHGGWLWASEDQGAEPPEDENGPWWLFHYQADGGGKGELVAAGLDRLGLIRAVEGVKNYG